MIEAKNDVTLEERAFQTILRNRVNHGGILAPGCGILKYGENGKGIKSRWYPETLRKRILAIGQVKERIDFIQGDGLKVLEDNAAHENTVYFIDPPYTAAGKRAGRRLYAHNELVHYCPFLHFCVSPYFLVISFKNQIGFLYFFSYYSNAMAKIISLQWFCGLAP